MGAGAIDLSAREIETNTQHRQLAAATLEIASIRAGVGEIASAAKRFGDTTPVSRGDGAESRIQACYISSDSHAHLIFQEDGEGFGAAFYLFTDGPNWSGSDLCSKLPLTSGAIQTANGLRLGLSRDETQTILGTPSKASPNQLTYILGLKKKTSPDKLKQLRAENQSLSDSDFHEAFDFYYVNSFVIAKFSDSKLVYLAVTEYESYP